MTDEDTSNQCEIEDQLTGWLGYLDLMAASEQSYLYKHIHAQTHLSQENYHCYGTLAILCINNNSVCVCGVGVLENGRREKDKHQDTK